VPKVINLLFVNRRNYRGCSPIGVKQTSSGNFLVTYGHDCEVTHLGTFKSEEEAFQCFKLHKENHVKEMADRYKEYIPQKLYDALYKYEFEITD
jgi:hypothetical protein